MKLSYNWLRQLIDIPELPEEIGKVFTATGLEVEGIEKIETVAGGLAGIVVGEVLTCETFMVKEKQLSLTTVDVGAATPSQIVCGAANVRAGQKVIVATVGTTIYPAGGQPFTIGSRKTYGHLSEGMICAEDEIGMGESHDGIMVLNTDLPNGTPAADYFGLAPDYTIEIGLTPNRADAASHLGAARDLRAALQRPLKMPSVASFKVQNNDFPIELVVENPEACPRFCGLTINGVTVQPSPDWLQKALRAIGLNPINNVVDATNYICHGLGQPMHAYDWHAIVGQKIVVKNATEGAKFTTLDKVERTLSATDLMVCNAEEPMGIGGIFGGTKSGIKDSTTRIYLECAYFEPNSIRKTALRHGLKTDASFRFERGTDPKFKLYALQYCALLIQEIAGGEVASEVEDFYPNPIPNVAVPVKYKNVDRLIGKVLDRPLMHRILQDLDIELHHQTADGFVASVPPYRVDVQREADIIEEILRIYGLDNIELSAQLSADSFSAFPVVDPDKQKLRIANLLAANGFNETMTNSLTKPLYNEAVRESLLGADVLMLNALSEDLSVMRQTMLFSSMESLAYNLNRRQRDLKLCEFGKTYHKMPDGKYAEKSHLVLAMAGSKHGESWLEKDQKLAYHDLAAMVHLVLNAFRVEGLQTQELAAQSVFDYGLTYARNKKPLVSFGQVKTKLTKMLDIKQPVFYADFDWTLLLKQYNDRVRFAEVSKFPEVRRDLSLVLDKGVSFEQIKQTAYKYERELLQAINVFDVYEGDNIGAEKKSYSVSFNLQDATQTLTDKVIDKTMQKLIMAFEKELGAVIRK
ncbi:MAG: phenylalanine--tRNA ligase subunit beta [Cytophagia bacterium]|nr:MAG: phenylalanine--tRNA ligase subunit beta [Runella sp.]TAG18252.1 MAG: phenylalanine--tRNA ligase subunit beta [Cytophagales bacterium]TAG39851.1 MAG: phenylalanine--tRNA ligase subunit beta [Cytophagia bacterium]TAG52664.1 MAG: phenylalanine--tRNA ligase subunit beta [Runella slithyformis]TAG78972.1 MAG: phenylalanine--tRNA ligase subunit beta [Cytophagales bacterium]